MHGYLGVCNHSHNRLLSSLFIFNVMIDETNRSVSVNGTSTPNGTLYTAFNRVLHNWPVHPHAVL